MAVQQRRLGEGEALAARARAGRGAAAGTGGNVGGGTAAASQATAFLEEVLGAGRGAAGDGEAKTDDRGAGAATAGGDDALNEEGEEAPAMTAASDSECEASASARQIGRVAGGERGQTNERGGAGRWCPYQRPVAGWGRALPPAFNGKAIGALQPLRKAHQFPSGTAAPLLISGAEHRPLAHAAAGARERAAGSPGAGADARAPKARSDGGNQGCEGGDGQAPARARIARGN